MPLLRIPILQVSVMDDLQRHLSGLQQANLCGAAAFVFGAEDVGVPFDAWWMVEQVDGGTVGM